MAVARWLVASRHRLWQCPIRVLITEIAEQPTAVWRRVAIAGLARGMLQDGTQISAAVKAADVDTRWETEYCDTISDKARAIGGGVVEANFHSYQRPKNPAT